MTGVTNLFSGEKVGEGGKRGKHGENMGYLGLKRGENVGRAGKNIGNTRAASHLRQGDRCNLLKTNGAKGGTRTPTGVTPPDPKSG